MEEAVWQLMLQFSEVNLKATGSREAAIPSYIYQGNVFYVVMLCFPFCLSDPGKPGVRSLGPDVRHKHLDVCKT